MLDEPQPETGQGISNRDIMPPRLHTHHMCHTVLESQVTSTYHTLHVEIDFFFIRIFTQHQRCLIETGVRIVQNMEMSLTSIEVAP